MPIYSVKAQCLSIHTELPLKLGILQIILLIFSYNSGTTTLLNAVPKILEIANSIGLSRVDSLFYSRKAFLFPEKQVYPHGRWDNEVSFLDHLFPETQFDTSGYVVGKVNRDHWCLYLATPISGTDDDGKDDQEDLTLEVMMTGLSKRKTKLFWGNSYTVEPDILVIFKILIIINIHFTA